MNNALTFLKERTGSSVCIRIISVKSNILFSAHSSRTKSERIRNEADTLMANCASKTQRSQQEANNRYSTCRTVL